uniref:Uncharacterized protein n=1 Tax=Eptatretus burgeri TaxID=7764 RepID=A0A8C4NA45_EPTBU
MTTKGRSFLLFVCVCEWRRVRQVNLCKYGTASVAQARHNGWSWPPHPLQLIAWIYFGFQCAATFGYLLPLFPASAERTAAYAVSYKETRGGKARDPVKCVQMSR